MAVPHPFPYQGSKRRLAAAILPHVPAGIGRLVEPFVGSGAVSLACAHAGRASRFWLNDSNPGLMTLWRSILEDPSGLAAAYEAHWYAQQGQERAYYDEVREQHNQDQEAPELLYLIARCVKAAVRYNRQGEFNQSPDNRRRGARPGVMRANLLAVSRLLGSETRTTTRDYRDVLEEVDDGDLVYMDPPYQGVSSKRDSRYHEGLDFDELVASLARLNRRGILFITSYDGRTGGKRHGRPLPEHLGLRHVELDAGRSSQATLLGKKVRTIESLYISPAVAQRIRRARPKALKA